MSRILIIDDVASIRTKLTDMLVNEGHEVHAAKEGEEALRFLSQNEVDLVITDILMPGKDGLETIIELRRGGRSLPILAMSGGGRGAADNYLDLASKLGASGVIEKPFTKEQLQQALEQLLATSG